MRASPVGSRVSSLLFSKHCIKYLICSCVSKLCRVSLVSFFCCLKTQQARHMMVDGGDPLARRLEKWLSFRLFVVCVLTVRWRQIPENWKLAPSVSQSVIRCSSRTEPIKQTPSRQWNDMRSTSTYCTYVDFSGISFSHDFYFDYS